MKIIIGVYDRELSHNLAIVLSSKKIVPIEAESMEEIPSLLKLHKGAMLLCEETSVTFYQRLQQEDVLSDVFLIYHPTIDTVELFKLRQFGIKSLIPYTENVYAIIEVIIKQLSMLSQYLKKDDKSMMRPDNYQNSKVAIHLTNTKKWRYGHLLGLNSSKVLVKLDQQAVQEIVENKNAENILMYLQGLNIRVYADLVYVDNEKVVFRYRQISKEDADRLAYLINYCQNNPQTKTMIMNI